MLAHFPHSKEIGVNMKTNKWIQRLVLLLVVATPLLSQAQRTVEAEGVNSGGGGDHIRATFMGMGERVIKFFELDPRGTVIAKKNNLDLEKYRKTLDVNKIQVTRETLIDRTGSIVESLVEKKSLLLNLDIWQEHLDRKRNIYYQVCHEMSRIADYNDENYIICGGLRDIKQTDFERYSASVKIKSPYQICSLSEPQNTASSPTYADPYYNKYLMPGQINYTEIFKGYDDMAAARKANRNEFINAISSLKMNEHGLVEIKQYSTDATYLALYATALKQAFGPATGIKHAASAITPTYVTVSAGLPGFERFHSQDWDGGFQLYFFATYDVAAEAKIEKIKMGEFKKLEEAAHEIRQKIFQWHKNDLQLMREHLILTQVFGVAPTEQEIKTTLKSLKTSPENSLSVTSLKINPENLRSQLQNTKNDLTTIVNTLKQINNCASTSSQLATANNKWLKLANEILNGAAND